MPEPDVMSVLWVRLLLNDIKLVSCSDILGSCSLNKIRPFDNICVPSVFSAGLCTQKGPTGLKSVCMGSTAVLWPEFTIGG